MDNTELQKLVDEAQDDGLTLDEKARRRATAAAVASLQTPTIEVSNEQRLRDTVIIAAEVFKMLNKKGYLKSFAKAFAEDQLIQDLIETIGERKCSIS